MITWMPTLYQQTFNLPLQTSLFYGLLTTVAGVIASLICALLIDKVGRKKWYTAAFFLASVPLAALALECLPALRRELKERPAPVLRHVRAESPFSPRRLKFPPPGSDVKKAHR